MPKIEVGCINYKSMTRHQISLRLRISLALAKSTGAAATVPLATVPAASHPVFNCISFSSLCLVFPIDFWAC